MWKIWTSLCLHVAFLIATACHAVWYPSMRNIYGLIWYAAVLLVWYHLAAWLWYRDGRRNERRELMRRIVGHPLPRCASTPPYTKGESCKPQEGRRDMIERMVEDEAAMERLMADMQKV